MSQRRVTIALPVYNGERFLAASIEAVLGQTYGDFELVISNNASTDGTDEICRAYTAADPRIRYVVQPRNLGAAGNHNATLAMADTELFKWASADDLYARDLLEVCVRLLDEVPQAVLAHTWTAAIDAEDRVIQAYPYPLRTASPSAPERLRSLLRDGEDLPGAIRADDQYGVVRTAVLRRVRPLDSYYHADQTWTAALALQGRFAIHPDWLYFRRHHDGRALKANPTVRSWTANLDPRRASRWRHPAVRLYGEFAWNYLDLVRRAPLSRADKRACYRHLADWIASRARRRLPGYAPPGAAPEEPLAGPVPDVRAVVAGMNAPAPPLRSPVERSIGDPA